MIRLRHQHPALRYGGMAPIETSHLLVFERRERGGSGEQLLCVFNLGHDPVEWRPPVEATRIEAINWTEADGATLPPLAGLVFRLA